MLKKVLKLYSKDSLIVIGLFLLALAARLLYLDKFPIGMTHDELNYILAAKSLSFLGRFVPGTAPAILPTVMQNYDVTIAEVPAFILSVLIGRIPLSLFTGRVIGALFSSMTVVILYNLVIFLSKDRKVALVASLLMIIGPWNFLMGRTVFETNFFVFFFLLGLLVLLKNKGWGIFWAFPLYLLGFLSYTGGQIAFFLFILLTLVYHKLTNKNDKWKPYLVFCLATVLLLAVYLGRVMFGQSEASRGGEIYSPNSEIVATQVDRERKLTVPSPLNKFFINKATVYVRGAMDRYLNAFSVNYLFMNGEFRAAFSLQKHGALYWIDAPLIILGGLYLFQKRKIDLQLILAVILVAPLTSVLSTVENSYSQRAALMFPFLFILAGFGFSFVWETLKKPVWKNLFATFMVLVYLVFLGNMLHTYFFRFPVYASDGWFFQDRLLSKYLDLGRKIDPNQKIIISSYEPKIIFEEYLFYNNLYEGEKTREINDNLNKRQYKYENIEFISGCLEESRRENVVWIYDAALDCLDGKVGSHGITRYQDVYAKYIIRNDSVCKDKTAGPYVHPYSYGDFSITDLNLKDLCGKWIVELQ